VKKIRIAWSLVPVLVLVLVACGEEDKGLAEPKTRICVDEKGTRVADTECTAPVAEGKPDENPVIQGAHRWHYVRQGKPIPPIGGSIHSGASKAAAAAAGTEPTFTAPAGTEPAATGAAP
jgi:hypothetical protein